jgi:DNA-binding LytR/AlgR family response regulator
LAYVQPVDCDELRVILCITFDKRAPPADLNALKAALINSEMILHSVETTGAFDFITEVRAPDMPAYQKWVQQAAEPLAKLAANIETSFVCKRFIRRPDQDCGIWVPSRGALRRIDCSQIDKIEAEGDYVQIHSHGHQWLLHTTLHAMLDRLQSKGFVQVNRSSIIRCDAIDGLTRQGRNWVVDLKDGSHVRVARSHVTATRAALRIAPAIPAPSPSNSPQTVNFTIGI